MADDLIDRLRNALASRDVSEVRMFGGICFMLNGNMLTGTFRDELMVRVGRDAHTAAVARPHARPMIQAGRTAEGYILVDRAGLTGKGLKTWLDLALAYVATLPPKPRKNPAARRKASP